MGDGILYYVHQVVVSFPDPGGLTEGLGMRLIRLGGLIEVASFPGSPGMRIIHAWRAWYIFSRDHDVIKIGPEFLEQKGNLLHVIQLTLHSTLGVYDIRSQ